MLAARAAAARGAAGARRLRGGETLRVQFAFDEYLARRERDHSFSLREHLRRVGGAIEK